MAHDAEDRLHQAVWAYHAAVQRRDGIEARVRRGEHSPDLDDRSLSAAEAVVESRIALYRMLIEDGWIPTPSVVQDIVYDDAVLHQRSE